MSTNVPNVEESRQFRLGQASAIDYTISRLNDLIKELRAERAALVLPTRFPRQGGGSGA